MTFLSAIARCARQGRSHSIDVEFPPAGSDVLVGPCEIDGARPRIVAGCEHPFRVHECTCAADGTPSLRDDERLDRDRPTSELSNAFPGPLVDLTGVVGEEEQLKAVAQRSEERR